ncbi:unnamed protein product [Sphagnum jensenii]|uniref:Uncharacterized protein n=1 Tax=Sphagnum jensenii TaxID=128206 RepID=A0ABP1A8W6_9BRYO
MFLLYPSIAQCKTLQGFCMVVPFLNLSLLETKLGGMKIKETLEVGSPVVIIEAPPMLKTAEPMPMMRPNTGTIKPGDAGRIIDRRPKDVWAVRFVIGAYLIDRRYFEPLEL